MTPLVVTPDWRAASLHEAVRIEQERQRILAGQYFLVRIAGNAGYGDTMRCGRCRRLHQYLTLMCVERPVIGLTRGLYAYYRTMSEKGVEQLLAPQDRMRINQIARVLGNQRDLAESHPYTARQLGDLGDMDVGAIALGLLEPIQADTARRLVEKINSRGVKPTFDPAEDTPEVFNGTATHLSGPGRHA